MNYVSYSKCECGAITIVREDAQTYSCMEKNRKKFFPDLDLRKLKRHQTTVACDHCGNHYGLDLCGCGSGMPFGACDAGLNECSVPMQTLDFWDQPSPAEALENVKLSGDIDADFFLHGVCGFFALALHQEFGYPVYVVAAEPEDWEDANDTWENRIVHIYCRSGDTYIDVRGKTEDEEAFLNEFADFLWGGGDEYLELEPKELEEFLAKSMDQDEYETLLHSAIGMIGKYRPQYEVKEVREK